MNAQQNDNASPEIADRDALVKKISEAMAAGQDSGGYETLFDMLAHTALKVIEGGHHAQRQPSLLDIARAICRSDEVGASCVMDDHPERPACSDDNCYRFKQARAVVAALPSTPSAPEPFNQTSRDWDVCNAVDAYRSPRNEGDERTLSDFLEEKGLRVCALSSTDDPPPKAWLEAKAEIDAGWPDAATLSSPNGGEA